MRRKEEKMGLFGTALEEVIVDYYGQKRRNKVKSDVQTYYQVRMNLNRDMRSLSNLYVKCFMACADVAILPAYNQMFWEYINASFQNIPMKNQPIFEVWPGFVDLAPIMSENGKVNTSIKLKIMDNGKVKFNISENAVTLYYNPLAPVAIMSYIRNHLSEQDFETFYNYARNELIAFKNSDKRSQNHNFSMPLLNQTNEASVAEVSQEPLDQKTIKFCSNCGVNLQTENGIAPKFCSSCGSKL